MNTLIEREIGLTGGQVRYRDTGGAGPAVVFVHGLLADGRLWDPVLPRLAAAGVRCLVPDWPLGAHRIPMPGADLTPPGVAALIGEFLERLDLREVTVVGNDTGGGLTQLLMARRPERVVRVVLTSSDAFEYFPPPRFRYLRLLPWLPGSLSLVGRVSTWKLASRVPFGFGGLTKHGLAAELTTSWAEPLRRDPGVRNDVRRFPRAMRPRLTVAAAEALRGFDRPVRLVWAWEDRAFPIWLAHRLAEVLPDARVVGVGDSYTFMPQDRPDRLVEEILEFLREHRALGPDPTHTGAARSAAPRASAQPR